MCEHASAGRDSDDPQEKTEPDIAFLKEISTAALAELLIKKGILNPAELLQQERELRYFNADHFTSSSSRKKKTGREGRLRQWASRRRWSRRLATLLLGWEWKKVRQEKAPH